VPFHPQPFAKAVAFKSLEWAIRFWPEEMRQWGQALLAESHEITRPAEAFVWALGGVTLFLRSHLSHLLTLLKLPPGRSNAHLPLSAGSNGSQSPRNSRLVTAILLLAVALLFVLPSGREATNIVTSSWRNFESTPSDTRVVERLAAKAEKEGDARELAFLANCHPDPDRSELLANRAVQLDPSLVWILASRFRRPDMVMKNGSLNRVRESDPDNAFVHILAAETALIPDVQDSGQSSLHLEAHIAGVGASATQLWPAPPAHAESNRHMERAFRSPRYDSYSQRHRDLTREGWRKVPGVPLSLVVYSFWSHFLPDLSRIERFADEKIEQAQNIAAAGRPEEAENILHEVTWFAQRLTQGSETDFERLGALEITRRGEEGLRKFYAQSGRETDERAAAAQLRELAIDRDKLIHTGMQSRADTWRFFRKRAILVQTSASLALVLAALTALSLVLLEFGAISRASLRRLRWIACRLADFGPPAVLVFATIFLLSFKPFAVALDRFRSTAPSNAGTPDLVWQLMALGFMRPFAYFFEPSGEAVLWMLLTIGLSLIALGIVARGILRHRIPV
jgi:hypothetical protein